MSAEAYFSSRNPGPDFRKEMMQVQDQPRLNPQSMIGLFGRQIADAGTSGLRALEYQVVRGGTGVEVSPEVKATKDADILIDFTAIVLGNAIMALEDTLISRSFDAHAFTTSVNRGLVGTTIMGFDQPEEERKIQPITFGAWKDMIELAKADPTLASFFQPGNESFLPEGMVAYLNIKNENTNRPIIDHVREMLPDYIRLAHPLTTEQQQTPLPLVFAETLAA